MKSLMSYDRTLNKDHGFLLVDKCAHQSSFDMVKHVRSLIKEKTVGHAGTLDPFATGLLILAIGRPYTKQIHVFQNMTKTYQGQFMLGKATTTMDPEGDIIQEDDSSQLTHIHLDLLKQKAASFIGSYSHIPPSFSAKKVKGQRSYKLARQGKAVSLEPVLVDIHDFSIHAISNDPYPLVDFSVTCSKGTYIRRLVLDLAETLSTVSYCTTLRRTHIGDFNVENAICLNQPDLLIQNHLIKSYEY